MSDLSSAQTSEWTQRQEIEAIKKWVAALEDRVMELEAARVAQPCDPNVPAT
jgi:hypothetical protein